VDTPIAVLAIVSFQRLKDSEFDPASVSIFLYGSNDFDGDQVVSLAIQGLDHFAESSLAEQFYDLIYSVVRDQYACYEW